MKHKTCDLEGALLDAAVAKAEGQNVVERHGRFWIEWPSCDEEADVDAFDYKTRRGYDLFSPSTEWETGGPILERERISVQFSREHGWSATMGLGDWKMPYTVGPTPLIAAMRCYVASKMGEEVEL